MMFQAFTNDADGGDRPAIPAALRRFSNDSEALHVLLIGSPEGITTTIHNLHQRRFAEVGDWSPLVPWSETEMVSLLTKRLQRGGNG